jgi:hypothetical protein
MYFFSQNCSVPLPKHLMVVIVFFFFFFFFFFFLSWFFYLIFFSSSIISRGWASASAFFFLLLFNVILFYFIIILFSDICNFFFLQTFRGARPSLCMPRLIVIQSTQNIHACTLGLVNSFFRSNFFFNI